MSDIEPGDGLADMGDKLIENLREPETMDLPDQMEFGVSVFQMTSGEPVMHVHRGPGVEDVSVAELWRMISTCKLNMELEMQSAKFVQALDSMRQRTRIVKP
jgi:hypothetical protein